MVNIVNLEDSKKNKTFWKNDFLPRNDVFFCLFFSEYLNFLILVF